MVVFKNLNLNGKITDMSIQNGIISHIGKTEASGLDCAGLTAYPGLIDVHIHGCGGYDTMDGQGLDKMSQLLASNGVTAWYPTTMTAPHVRLMEVTKQDTSCSGAQFCGFHLEGPYLSKEYPGVQATEYMHLPDVKEFNMYNDVKLVTVAPELEGCYDFIDKCEAVVSLGHSGCGYDQACKAFSKGAKCVTHIFNAMPPFYHRAPSLVGAAMDSGVYAQLICDGVHLHRSAVMMLYKTFGADRLILISDGTRAAGMPEGTYELGGRQITVKDKKVTDNNGVIAGSAVFLSDCVKKAIEFGIDKDDAIKMATQTPAEMMGINKGKLLPGYDGDMLLADDKGNLIYTVVGGRIVYRR